MARGAEKQAKETYGRSVDLYGDSKSKSDDLYNQLHSTYSNEANNPQGFAAQDLNAMNTADQQSLGGGLSAAEGAANEHLAATRNSGGYAAALDEASRDAGRTHSENAINTQMKNAALREAHREEGVAGEGGLYSSKNNDVLSSLGLQNQSTDTMVKAEGNGWFQNMLGLINAGSNAATAAAKVNSSGCWVAIELYGEYDFRTKLLRHWIFNEWKTPFGRLFAFTYYHTGQRVASLIRRFRLLRKVIKFGFDRLYTKACRETK